MRVLAFFIMISFAGCMEELQELEPSEVSIPEIGIESDEIETLSSNELSLAKTFCQALSEKEESFPRNYIGATISFKVKQRECSEDKSELKEAVIKARLGSDSRSGILRFFPMDYYLPMMTEIETANQGIFAEFCPDMLLNVQKTNSIELSDGKIQIFRFLQEGSDQVMAQVLTSDEIQGEINRIQEVVVVVSGNDNRPRGLSSRKIDLVRCGNLEGNENSSLWSQEI